MVWSAVGADYRRLFGQVAADSRIPVRAPALLALNA
jgi:hypothetical protein